VNTGSGGGGGFMDAIFRFFYGFNPFSGNNESKVINNVFNVNTQK
jgi:hypothetical protein